MILFHPTEAFAALAPLPPVLMMKNNKAEVMLIIKRQRVPSPTPSASEMPACLPLDLDCFQAPGWAGPGVAWRGDRSRSILMIFTASDSENVSERVSE